MDVIIKTIARGVFPFIILLGVFVLFHGHLTPGGSFPGGAIVASGFALIAVAFGLRGAEKLISEKTLHVMEAIVALILVALLVYESFLRDFMSMTGNQFALLSSPEILSLNIVGGLMVMCALTLIVYLMMRE